MTTRYRTVIILAAIAIIAYLCVDIFYKVMEGRVTEIRTAEITAGETVKRSLASRPSLETYRIISERNLFGSIDKIDAKGVPINLDELEPTKLGLTLLGTVSGTNGGFAFAVIEEGEKGKQGLFREGDAVSEATVARIMRGVVILRVNGRDEILRMKEANFDQKGEGQETPRQVDSNIVKLTKTDLDDALKNMAETLSQVRIRPYFSSGKPEGFMLSGIKAGSIFEKMGIKNSDIIKNVNGQPIKSPNDMLTLYNGLQSGSSISLDIKRKGEEQTLEYVFE